MQPSIRATRIAAVLNILNSHRPLSPDTAPDTLRLAIKQAAAELGTESRRIHRDLVWAMGYRDRGAQDRAARDLIDPACPAFMSVVHAKMSPFDAAHVAGAIRTSTSTPTPIIVPPKKRSGPNPTSLWLNGQIVAGLIPRLVRTVHKRYPIEDIEDVRGEVHLRIAHWCSRGSFDAHLAEGHPPTISRMSAWVGNRIKSSLGRRGQDALWRQMRGSRTETEWRSQAVHPESVTPDMVYTVGLESGGEEGVVQQVVIDPKSLVEPETPPNNATLRATLRSVIRAKRPNAAARYIRVLESMVEEIPRAEFAEAEDISVRRTSKLTARVRDDLRSAMWSTVSDARKILRYVIEEPYITHGELSEDLRIDSEAVDRAVRLLTDPEIGYISDAGGRSYAVTGIGEEVALTPAQDGVVGRMLI
jgi:hypothetical protein